MPLSTLPDLSAPLLEWAQWYAAQGWPVIPMHTPTPGGCSCSQGPTCQHPGKHPRTIHGRNDASTNSQTVADWWTKWPEANIAIRTDTLVVIDTDPRHDGPNSLRTLEAQHDALPDCPRVISGSGGDHYYFSLPSDGIALMSSDGLIAPGVDVKSFGGNINVPPSLHASGQRYVWDGLFSLEAYPLCHPPDWFVELARAARPAQSHSYEAGVSIPEGSRYTYLIGVAARARYNGFSEAQILSALEIANQNCQPPEDETELRKYAHWAAHKAMAEPEVLTPATLSVPPPVGWSVNGVHGTTITATMGTPWRKELFAKKNGELTQNVFNISRILEYHEHWQQPGNALWWDSVRGRPMCGDTELTDDLLLDIASWFGGAERLPITSPRLLEQCVLARCKKNPRDLLQLWLNGLEPWDGSPRLDTWLVDVGGAISSEYTTNVSRGLLVSMVARAMHPGCHYRFVVIFEGAEEIGKSTLVRELASPDWYVELSIGLETKEAHMMLQGAWVAELSELDSLNRTEETRLKAFITMREDSYVPKYSNFRQRTERRAIFIGTTNEESYLKGQSGNTRYLPIKLTGEVNIGQFQAIRSQLFAEALHYYYGHTEDWWQLSDEAMESAKEEREQRRTWNVYEDALDDWLEHERFARTYTDDSGILVLFQQDQTSWREIARWFLKLERPEQWKDRSLQMQIAASLKALGWHRCKLWRQGKPQPGWRKSPDIPPF